MKMLGNTALLSPLTPEPYSKGGIWYSGKHIPDKMQYRVDKIGPGKRLRGGLILPPPIRSGDFCLLNPNRVGVKHTFEDGRLIVDADQIEMIWR